MRSLLVVLSLVGDKLSLCIVDRKVVYSVSCKGRCQNAKKDSNKKVFHSFRHTVIHHLQQKGVDEKRIKVMEGHKIDDLSYYQHGYGLKVLADEVVAQIDYGHLVAAARKK